MPWALHTTGPTKSGKGGGGLRAALEKARDLRLRSDERSRILVGVDTNDEEVGLLRAHMDRAITAAVLFVGSGKLVQVSISGDLASDGVIERTTIAIDVLPTEPSTVGVLLDSDRAEAARALLESEQE